MVFHAYFLQDDFAEHVITIVVFGEKYTIMANFSTFIMPQSCLKLKLKNTPAKTYWSYVEINGRGTFNHLKVFLPSWFS